MKHQFRIKNEIRKEMFSKTESFGFLLLINDWKLFFLTNIERNEFN